MVTFFIGASLFSIFPIMFFLEDMEGCGIYDPGSGQPMPKSLRERFQEWRNRKSAT